MPTTPTPYLLDNAADQATDRLQALATMFDDHTRRHLLARGLNRGWHCLEIGAGNGSVAQWLGERVGSEGRVVATDLDPRHLEARTNRTFEILRHDIVRDPLPDAAFDLIHVRLVLVHLPEWEQVINKLVAALKPGGWLVDEEYDSDSMRPDPVMSEGETLRPTYDALARLMTDHGFDRRFGRRLYRRLRAAGLTDVGAEGRVEMLHRGNAGTALVRANWTQLRDQMVDRAYVTGADVERDLAALDDADFMMPSSVLWTAWGRRAGTA